ncbi:NAD(P)/FAD-dependent oxidoreductase [Celeribacter baekdonensis]|uniref:Cyclopropane-fatty-acyl-phospholipid synthase n=1 Tax=Celeribacter baekdonensis TaxID=875171 RepID=A0A2R4LZM2_9RHOB|nr:FAD-dependent oxidoreductase [Celeribacter baekdonensis]AVW90317.1 cyclopropane-fatty-acyl-phospholipid synthase [Celeribacter baekdonensis]
MSFDVSPAPVQRIAIIGGGISGLAAAYRLAGTHAVTLFEAEPRLGGHARTVMAGVKSDRPVDTGFIVFNYANYPHLTEMFAALDVPVEPSDMSFGATIDGGRVEYGLKSLAALVGQKRNLLRPGFVRMVRDIFRFNAGAEAAAKDEHMTIGEMVEDMKLGDWFQRYYLMPICGAIWSTSPEDIRAFPARALVQFFRNHALLSATGQHQWWTVSGGSIEYVRRLEAYLLGRGADLRTGTPIATVQRDEMGVEITPFGGASERFDQVIFACHSDTALKLLAVPSAAETRALSDLRYQDNRVVLHRDASFMPKRKTCWSSWVYQAKSDESRTQIGVTYWMNRLQNIPETDPLFVTLNPAHAPDPAMVYDEVTFRHPVFDHAALRAQGAIAALQGQNRTWFAGAYLGNGFHEDGFASAVRVTDALTAQAAMAATAVTIAAQ